MEQDTSKEETTGGPAGEPFAPPRRGGSNVKWYAIIGALIIIVAALAVIDFTRAPAAGKVTPQLMVGPTSVLAGDNYTYIMTTNAAFDNVTIWWGDGTSNVYNYNNTNLLYLTHTYNTPGTDYIYYEVAYSSGSVTGASQLMPVTVSFPEAAASQTYGYAAIVNSSASPQLTGQNLYAPGTKISTEISTLGNPLNVSYQVVQQIVKVTSGKNVVQKQYYNFTYDKASTNFYYKTPGTTAYFNISSLSSGNNILNVTTVLAKVTRTDGGAYTVTGQTYYTMGLPSFSNGNIVSVAGAAASKKTFTNAELAPGGYSYLDPQVAYDTVSNEILMNTLQTLVAYQGNNTSKFFPELAASLPTLGNGINDNYANYTSSYSYVWYNTTAKKNVTTTVTYNTFLKPYENYTFKIRNNATWQDGSTVSAYDVYYAFVRDMLFLNGPTGTPGWIQAQYMLPGNYYATNTFYNITKNLTYSAAQDTVTFHFQQPLAPTLVYMILDASGAYIGDPAYYVKAGETLNFTTAGFQAYSAYASPNNMPNSVRNGLFADGPYQLNYVIPGTQVVFSANPHFNAVQYYPAPSIQNVVIKYVNSYSQSYLLLKSGEAQTGGIPSSAWSLTTHLKDLGLIYTQSFATPSIFWYNFNFKINTKNTTAFDPNANLPTYLFDSWNARNAFAYAYDYPFYMNYQVGNALYGVQFGTQIAGMIPPGFQFFQSMSELNSSTLGVPYFSMAKAEHFWNNFMNNAGATLGLSWGNSSASSTPTVMFNGKQLTIPIAIYAADPVDLNGASTWGANMAKLGVKVDVVPINFAQLLTFFQPGNSAAIWILGWAPDYPYPADYLQPMALPGGLNLSVNPGGTYPVGNNFNAATFNDSKNPLRNTTMVAKLEGMIGDYNTAFASAGNAAGRAFQAMNKELINLTAYVYLFAQNMIQILSTQLNPAPNSVWQTNIMFGGGGDFFYQYFQYK